MRIRKIEGARADLTRVRNPGAVTVLEVTGGVRSLRGLDRFTALHCLALTAREMSDLSVLTEVSDRIVELLLRAPRGEIGFRSVEALTRLELLVVGLPDKEAAGQISELDLSCFPELRSLHMENDDYGTNLPLGWVRDAKHLEYLTMPCLGINEADTDLVCAEGHRWRAVSFAWRSAEQTDRIRDALRGRCEVTVWDPFEGTAAGAIEELDWQWWTWFAFSQAGSGEEQSAAMSRLMRGWKDLADAVEWEQSGDMVHVQSQSREVLEELVRRAEIEGVVSP